MIIDALHDEIINKYTVIEEEIEYNIIKKSMQNSSFAKVIKLNENEYTVS